MSKMGNWFNNRMCFIHWYHSKYSKLLQVNHCLSQFIEHLCVLLSLLKARRLRFSLSESTKWEIMAGLQVKSFMSSVSNGQLWRHVLVSGVRDDSWLQGFRATQWLKSVCFIQMLHLDICWIDGNKRQRSRRAFIFASSPETQTTLIIGSAAWYGCWQIALLCLLSCMLHILGCTK